MVRPLHIRGAYVWNNRVDVENYQGTLIRDFYSRGDRIVAGPLNDAQIIDLEGYTVYPGLINAHDHLELNHYPRSKFRERYDNARQWHEDMNVRLNEEPYKTLRAYPLWDKLFIGGLKNLLCGATTVAHHNPPHKDLWRKDFPVRVLKHYGWSHSFYLSTDEEIVRSYQSTPKNWPWFIHLAEGTDDVAAEEFSRLKALGCSSNNTVIVHGVGVKYTTDEDELWEIASYQSLAWCPSTNIFLLGETTDLMEWLDQEPFVALGSDSRLTANGDLLDELRAASEIHPYPDSLIDMVLANYPAMILGLDNSAKVFDVGSYADWIAFHHTDDDLETFCEHTHRANLALVVKGGVPQIGDPELMAKFPDVKTVDATLDGKPKAIHIELAKRIHANSLKEPGLEVDTLPKRKLFSLI